MPFPASEAEQSDEFVGDITNRQVNMYNRNVQKMNNDYILLYSSRPNIDAIPSGIQTVIRQSGYGNTTQRLLNESFQDVVDESFDLYKRMLNKSFNFTDESLDRLGVWKDQAFIRFDKLISGSTNDVTALMVNSLLTDLPDEVFATSMTQLMKRLRNFTQTEADTGLAGYYRNSNVLLATDNGLNDFFYSGHFGGDIRPFCAAHVGQIKTIEQWDQLDNGQLNPVSVYCGGFNCHHTLIATLDKSDALSRDEAGQRRREEDERITAVIEGGGETIVNPNG